MLVEPFEFDAGGFVVAFAIDAVVGDAFDDVVFGRNAALGEVLVRLLDGGDDRDDAGSDAADEEATR